MECNENRAAAQPLLPPAAPAAPGLPPGPRASQHLALPSSPEPPHANPCCGQGLPGKAEEITEAEVAAACSQLPSSLATRTQAQRDRQTRREAQSDTCCLGWTEEWLLLQCSSDHPPPAHSLSVAPVPPGPGPGPGPESAHLSGLISPPLPTRGPGLHTPPPAFPPASTCPNLQAFPGSLS